jgi:NIPSNAP
VKRTGLGRIVSVAAATVPTMTPEPCCPVMELRQYKLRPGQREVLIELFDRELVEPQEALGMRIVGQFRDLDRPDRFVWLRGFADMQTRLAGLTAFYGGPAWKAHAAAANATMLEVDDVLLLRPAGDNTAFPRSTRAHAARL